VHCSPIAISSVKQAAAHFDIFADVMTLVPKVLFFFLKFFILIICNLIKNTSTFKTLSRRTIDAISA